jgi:hypothetical protein
MVAIYLHDWEGEDASAVFTEYNGERWNSYKEEDSCPLEEKPEFKGVEILLASYITGNYEGTSFVLFRRDGKLYEVNAYHCSCFGLEGQWDPEEVTKEELSYRLKEGRLGVDYHDNNEFAHELSELLLKLPE